MEDHIIMETTPDDIRVAHSKYILYISMIFVAVLLIANTVATKVVAIGLFTVTGGILVFPISYIFGDILTEVYGFKATRKIIWTGFGTLILMSLVYWLVQILPAAPFWQNQGAYDVILGSVPRIVLGSIIGYFAGEFTNSYVVSKMKIWTNGEHLWSRIIGSTVAGEAVDTALFTTVAFAGILPGTALISIAISGYSLKVAYEIIAMPITYQIVAWLKRAEGIDTYDRGISYSPFSIA